MSLKINSARIHHCAPDWSWSPRNMPDCNLWTVLGGNGELESGGLSCRLARGSAMLFPPGSNCEASHDPKRPLAVICVHFDCSGDQLPGLHTEARDPQLLEKILERIQAAWSSDDVKGAATWLEAALQELLESTAKRGVRPGSQESAIDGICDLIATHPERKWGVPEMAERMNVCADHFSRLFRKCKGMAPNEFAIDARIDYAKSLLSSSSHPVERVAELCGYKSLSFLTRQFKAKTGQTPSAFRHRNGGV